MSVPVTSRGPAGRSPRQRALLTLLIALVVTAAACTWAVLAAPAPAPAQAPVAWTAGVAAFVVCAVLAAAVYQIEAARRARDIVARGQAAAGRLERELSLFTGEVLPTVLGRLRDGESAERALVALPRLASGHLQQVLSLVSRDLAAAQGRAADAQALHAAAEAEAARLAGQVLPALAKRMRAGESADTVLASVPHPASGPLERLLTTAATQIGAAERRTAAAMAACANAAARVQAQTTRMLAELRELEDRYSEEKVFADLLSLDHRISQMDRLADSIALLSGGRSGRRWTKPIVMESILRGAMGRIEAYRRVRVHSTTTVAVAGYAAEGVMHALAELLDNAASFSTHGSEVHVYVEEEDAGVVITVEDSGLGMRKRERQRAEQLVSEPLDLATLPGSRLGLAVVGRLASKHGLTVSFRPSSRGGTGAVVMIPRQLVTQPRQDAPPRMPGDYLTDGLPSLGGPGHPGDGAGEAAGAVTSADSGPIRLPKRPPGQMLAAATRSMPAAEERRQLPGRGGERFAAFRQAADRSRPRDAPDASAEDASSPGEDAR